MRILRHQKIDQIIRVGQRLAVPTVDRHLAVNPQRTDVGLRLADVFPVGVQPLDQVSVTGTECRGERPVAGTQMDDESALAANSLNELRGLGFVV